MGTDVTTVRTFLPIRTLWPWLVAVLCVWGYGCEQRRAGMMGERLAALRKEYIGLAQRQQIVRREFVHDTVILTKRVTRYETLRDSVFARDTILSRDTVFIRVVASADSTIRACRDVVSSCAENLRIADSLRTIDRRLIKTLEASRPGFARRWGERLVVGSVGYAIRAITAK